MRIIICLLMVFSSVSVWAYQEPQDTTQKPNEPQQKEQKVKDDKKTSDKKKKKEPNYFPFWLFPVIAPA